MEKFSQMKASGRDGSVARKHSQWVLRVWQERNVEPQSWPVWFRGLRCTWLVWLCQLSHQCKRATTFPCADTSPSRNKMGPSVKGPCLEICDGEEINTERL